uniref:PsbT n=1 Tax=Kuruna debilis TaxID=1531501 RepID=A0A1B1FCF0_9POAL|nr:PsbT [Kuruna debilis]
MESMEALVYTFLLVSTLVRDNLFRYLFPRTT